VLRCLSDHNVLLFRRQQAAPLTFLSFRVVFPAFSAYQQQTIDTSFFNSGISQIFGCF